MLVAEFYFIHRIPHKVNSEATGAEIVEGPAMKEGGVGTLAGVFDENFEAIALAANGR